MKKRLLFWLSMASRRISHRIPYQHIVLSISRLDTHLFQSYLFGPLFQSFLKSEKASKTLEFQKPRLDTHTCILPVSTLLSGYFLCLRMRALFLWQPARMCSAGPSLLSSLPRRDVAALFWPFNTRCLGRVRDSNWWNKWHERKLCKTRTFSQIPRT